MAEEENTEALSLEGQETPSLGRKKKLIIIIASVVLLSGIAIGSYFLFFSGDDATAAEQIEAQVPDEVTKQAVFTTYVAMPRPFVFNVQDGKRDRLVQIKVQLMVHSDENAELAKKHTPLLEGTLVRVFGAATVEQLRSPAGKSQLRIHALEALNEATSKVENKAIIDAVLFTGFVLQ
jgi:flagellar FliL protein